MPTMMHASRSRERLNDFNIDKLVLNKLTSCRGWHTSSPRRETSGVQRGGKRPLADPLPMFPVLSNSILYYDVRRTPCVCERPTDRTRRPRRGRSSKRRPMSNADAAVVDHRYGAGAWSGISLATPATGRHSTFERLRVDPRSDAGELVGVTSKRQVCERSN